MNHDFVKNNSIKYIDGGLAGEEKLLFEEHLSKCESCKKDFTYIISIWNSEKKVYSVPDSLWDKISGEIIGRTEKSTYWDIITAQGRKYSLVFVLALSIFLGTYLGNKLLSPDSKASESFNVTEEYYPSGNVAFKTLTPGLER